MERRKRKLKERQLRRQRTEFLKSVFIVVLTLTFGMLAYSLFKTQHLTDDNNNILNKTTYYSDEIDAINLYFTYTSPEYILFNTETGREVFYTDSEPYSKAQKILEDINKSIFNQGTQVSEITDAEIDIFTNIDECNLLYVSYPYHRYPRLISQFFENPSSRIAEYISSYKKVILVPAENATEGIFVYIKDEKTGKTYKIKSNIASAGLQKLLGNTKKLDDRYHSFAYELNFSSLAESDDAVGTVLSPDIIIPLKTQFLPVIKVSPPEDFETISDSFTDKAFSTRILNAFNFQESYIRQYIDKDNVLVCVSETATLKLYPDGIIEYNSIDTKSGVNLVGSTKLTPENSYFYSLTGVSHIINSIIPLTDNNEKSFKIRLCDLQSESFEVAEYKFMFDYYLNGARIILPLYHGIEATTKDGYLTSMRINLKNFENTYEKTSIEPLFVAIDRFCADKKSQSTILISDCVRSYSLKESVGTVSASWQVK